uniref:hypothetical protein n=1 Tax=Polynucleobacter sp. TaxID=2029855 RepID=UPI0040485782
MLLRKIYDSTLKDGLTPTLLKVFYHLIYKIKRIFFTIKVLNNTNTEDKFNWIYKNNYWGKESVSGEGSTLLYTENIRHELPVLILNFNIKSIFDAPCGDFNWMSSIINQLHIQYIGADIVEDLIISHTANYSNASTKFQKINLISGKFPNVDLMFCRDCLFHLSYEDIRKVLLNFINSEIPYLLTSTYKNLSAFSNTDIKTGDFRLIDLFSHPFNFPNNPLARFDDWIFPEPEREMCLFSKLQVMESLQN